MIFDSLRGVAIQELVGINSVFLPVFLDHISKFTQSNRIPIYDKNMSEKIAHDRLFKELISTFFIEFIELFFPEVLKYLDTNSV